MSSGDWRFASIRGNLKWTSPALQNGGVELFSELSPTLIVGHQEEGDVLPVDYIKLSTVRSAKLISDTTIELVRDGASTALLVAPTASSAAEWNKMINIAIGEGKSATKPPTPVPAAASAPIAAPLQPVPAADRQHFQAAASPAPIPPSSFQPVRQPAPTEQAQQRSLPPAAPAAVVQPSVTPSSAVGTWGPAPTSGFFKATPTAPASSDESCAFDSNGAHDFRSLQSITGGPRAQTTTVATHIDVQKPLAATQRPADSGLGIRQQSTASTWSSQAGFAPVNLTPQLSDHQRPVTGRQEPSLGLGIGQGNGSKFLGTGTSRPLPTEMRTNENIGDVASAGAYSAGGGGGFPMGGFSRKRSGMLVDVPPNPQVNRNIAPNISAIWKEWTGPDGVLYVSHEPTGTIQRRIGNTDEFETLLEGNDDIPHTDMMLRPYSGMETAVDLNTQTIKNLNRYGGNAGGGAGMDAATSPNVYRQDPVLTPRGQYSPTRRTALNSLVSAPRQSQSAYSGRRVHQLTLGPAGEEAPGASAIEHQIQILGATGLKWDPKTGTTISTDGTPRGDIGPSTLEKQWEHVRRILLQGRLFKKHALRTTQSSFRFVFLTADNAYVVCVPTSQVPFNVSQDPMTFGSVTETIQYYGPESRAIALNTITHVSMGSDEAFVRQRRGLVAENVFCIVSRTHAFILECNTSEEAKYFSDAWTFFLFHSKPVNLQKNKPPQVKNPITFGTRAGIAF